MLETWPVLVINHHKIELHTSEGTFFVNVFAFNSIFGGFETETDFFEPVTSFLVTFSVGEDTDLLLESFFTL